MKINSWIPFLRRAADAATVVASFAAAYYLYLRLDPMRSVTYSLYEYSGFGGLAAVIFLSLFQNAKLYGRTASLLNVVETRHLFVSWGFGSLLIFGITFYFRFLDLSRIMLTYSLVLSLVLLVVERSFFTRYAIRSAIAGDYNRKAVIFGAGVVGRHLYKRIFHSPALGIRVIGFLDDDETQWNKEVHMGEIRTKMEHFVLGGLQHLPEMTKKSQVSEIFIAMPSATYQRNLEIAETARKLGLKVSVVPPTYGHLMHNLEVAELGGIPIIQEKASEPNFLYPIFKRSFDLLVSSTALIILSPIMLGIALAIKLDSAGPIIFKQKRVGLNGKEFDFYKFRSMSVDANPYGFTPKSSQDPRITKFGRWLRRSSLDELPQFLNVLKGHMSIVGPRPEMPFIVASYNEEQKERLRVKPGITGVWQISAVRGEPIHANMEYDLFYIEHRSLLLDIIIMIKTVATAIRGIGAY